MLLGILVVALAVIGMTLSGYSLWRIHRHASGSMDFPEEARKIVTRLRRLEKEYQRMALDAFSLLERGDRETARLAMETFDNRDDTAAWFAVRVQSLNNKMPWECMAEGDAENVRRILNCIIYGIPG